MHVKLGNVNRILKDINKVFEQHLSSMWHHQIFSNTQEHSMSPILRWRILKINKSGVEMTPGDKDYLAADQ